MNSRNLEQRNIGVVAPHLVDEWDFEKNGLTPDQVFGGSVKNFWWKCLKEKHSWEASPNARTRGNGCPYCSGTKILSGVTDFGTVYPEYVEFWDEKKNKKPIDKTSSTNGTVFLFCDKAHEYSLDLSSIKRAHDNNKVVKCTICSGKKIVSGINDFATFYPEFVQYIDSDKNKPEKIYYRKYSAIHWKCSKNHLFSSRIEIALRDSKFHCPYCEHKFLLSGFNDVKTFFGEEICEIWGVSNVKLPEQTIYHNDVKYSFRCKKGHSWTQTIDCIKGFGGISCVYCSGENKNAKITEIIPGVNDLATTHPHIARMFSPDSKLKATEVTHGTKKIITIECSLQHKRDIKVKNLVTWGSQECQQCIREGNNLLKKIPDLPERLDLEKNTVEDIENLTIGSRTIVHLKCKLGHTWEITPYNIEKWGGCPYCSSQRILKGFNDIPTTAPQLLKIWNYEKNGEMNIYPEDYTAGSNKKVWWKCDKDHEYLSSIGNRKLYGCPECAKLLTTSKGEKEVFEFVKSILPKGTVVLENDRTLIKPKELDIYIPEKKIAIEYNGLYWHSEEMLRERTDDPKNYHYNKWKACRDAGVQLITVWEDEWRDKPEIVKSMLAHKLGLGQNGKVYGRNVIVLDIDGDTARDFCNKHHIQGFTGGAKYFALVDKSDLSVVYAVSIWRKLKNELYLDRYCTSTNVVGGMGKLLKAGEKWGKDMGCSQIITFADHQVSDGGLYHSLGFTMDRILMPDYRYIHEGLRKHKFGFRLKRFRNDPALKYVEGYTEKQLAELNDLPRLWDFGKTRFVKEIV